MPTLIIEQPDKRTGGPITGRVLIGRLPTNGVVVADTSVSRLHAWIDQDQDHHYFVADGGSLTGTFVNGRAIEKRRLLGDGDVIRVGLAQIIFTTEDELPEGVRWIDLGGIPPGDNIEEAGVLFDCPCGSPAWFKAGAIGQSHVCRHCGRTILIPASSGVVADMIGAPVIVEPGIPQSAGDAHGDVSALHPTDENGIAEPGHDGHSSALFDRVAAHEERSPAQAHEPLFAPHIEGASEGLNDSEPTPLLGAPHVAMEDSSSPELEGAMHAHGEYALEPTGARESLFRQHAPRESSASANAAASEPMANSAEPVSIEELIATPTAEATCSICHSPIAPHEILTACPSCGLTFHADCWRENLGCSAYGCSQVDALKPVEAEGDLEHLPAVEIAASDEEPEAQGFPWESAFLFVSVAGALMGALAYGVPALIGAIGTAIYLLAFQESRKRRSVAIVALLVCLLGVGAGIYVSYEWWNGWPMFGALAHRGGRP